MTRTSDVRWRFVVVLRWVGNWPSRLRQPVCAFARGYVRPSSRSLWNLRTTRSAALSVLAVLTVLSHLPDFRSVNFRRNIRQGCTCRREHAACSTQHATLHVLHTAANPSRLSLTAARTCCLYNLVRRKASITSTASLESPISRPCM